MEILNNSTVYTPEIATQIEPTGPLAVSIKPLGAGLAGSVKALLEIGAYLDRLESQLNQEKEILANEANLQHLARRKISQMYEIKESPPAME